MIQNKYFTLALFFILFCEMIYPVSAETTYHSGESICNGGSFYGVSSTDSLDPWCHDWHDCYASGLVCGVDVPYGDWYYGLTRGEECGDWSGTPELIHCTAVTPTPTPTPSEDCVTRCGHTWTAGFTADDILLDVCVLAMPLAACEVCGWQMAAMEEQFPCAVPPEVVPTYAPTPLPTVPPPPTALPTPPPGPSPGPQVIEMGGGDIHGIDFTVPTIATIAIPAWDRTVERGNITALAGNLTDPYLNSVDGFSVGVTSVIQKIFYLPNWVMAHIYSSIQPVAVAFVDIVTVVCEWGSVPLQLMRLALDNTPFGIQALLIYGVCLEMVIYLLRGDT